MFGVKAKNIDIIVGICTKNCEDTVANVIKTVDLGLKRYFPRKKSLIFVSDISSDKTEQNAKSVKTSSEFLIARRKGSPEKGSGVKQIFLFSKQVNAKAIALVDGDLMSIKPEWIKALIKPVLKGNDLAVPLYKRHRLDSVVTNHLYFPLVSVLYGRKIRQPIGGEFGLSKRLVEKLLKHPLFPDNFGIDIFITTTAIVENMCIIETRLGHKIHTSTKQYSDFEKLLVPMFNQSVRTMLDLTFYNKEFLKHISEIRGIRKFGTEINNNNKNNFHLDTHSLMERFRREYEDTKNSRYLSKKTKSELNRDMKNDCIISIDTWADCVYDLIPHYNENKEDILHTLRTLWIGRYVSFIRETEDKTEQEAEEILSSQIGIFANKKKDFLKNF